MRDCGSNRMWHRAAFVPLWLSLFLGVTLCGAARPQTAGQTAAEPGAVFPLHAGAHWVYQAVLRWGSPDSATPQEKIIEWKMEVDRVVRRGHLFAAVVKGFPRDLDKSMGNDAPAESLIVETAGSKFYWIPPASFKDTLARLDNPKDSLAGLTSEDEIFLDFPLTQGEKFCDMTGMIRTDGFYCWVVGEPDVAELGGAKGIPPDADTVYPVEFLTADDATSFDFVPGVGLTRYSYQVHGSAASVVLRLVEFHPGSP